MPLRSGSQNLKLEALSPKPRTVISSNETMNFESFQVLLKLLEEKAESQGGILLSKAGDVAKLGLRD